MAATKTKKTAKKTASKTTPARKQPAKTKKPRKIQKPQYKSFRLSKRLRYDSRPLPKARHMLMSAVRMLRKHWRVFTGILVIQLLLLLFLVQGFGLFSSDLPQTRDLVQEVFGSDKLITGAALFGVLLSSTSGNGEVASLYNSIILLIGSLAIIWTLRQVHAREKPTTKEAFYKGMYPLIPFLLVVLVILIQLLPLALGNLLYSIVISNGIAVGAVEKTIWALLFGFLALLSLYMVTSSIFALYIVTLPDIAPMQALRSARKLVLHRRMMIIRKVVFAPFALLIIGAVIMAPVLLFATVIAEAVFFVLTATLVVVGHAYFYQLYRELL